MPVKIERSNPHYKPGRYYPKFIDPETSFSQSLLRKLYMQGHPDIALIGGPENHLMREEDRARQIENLKFHPRPGSEPLIKIKMFMTGDSSPDGVRIVTYKGGETYELGQAQGSRFVRKGWAKLIDGKLSDIEDHPDIEAERAKLKECMNAAPKKLKVKMRETHDSSPDGIHALRFREKETYELPEDLGLAFIRSGWAVLSDDKKSEKEEEK